MFEDPAIIGGAAVSIAAAAGIAYRYARSGGKVEADVDNDGDAEVTFESPSGGFDCNDDAEDPAYQGVSRTDIEAQTQEQPDPTPEYVEEIGEDLTDIKGIGPTRAEDFREEGFDTAADLYYASDENLEAVHGIGANAVSQIREDIGSIEDEGNDGNSDDGTEEEEESSDEQSNSEATTEDSTDESENSSTSDQSESSSSETTEDDGDSSTSDEDTEEESQDGGDDETEDSADGGESADAEAAA